MTRDELREMLTLCGATRVAFHRDGTITASTVCTKFTPTWYTGGTLAKRIASNIPGARIVTIGDDPKPEVVFHV